MLGLFGLLLAFSFSGSAERFQNRRALIVQQAQAVGTAYARLDLLEEPARGPIRKVFREYVDLLLADYRAIRDVDSLVAQLDVLEAKGQELWSLTAAACREERHRELAEVIPPAVNEMLDVALARKASLRTHPPIVIHVLLFTMALGSALMAGFGMSPSARMNWIHAGIFAVFSALTIFVILDLEFPRFGLIQVGAADEILRGVRRGMD